MIGNVDVPARARFPWLGDGLSDAYGDELGLDVNGDPWRT